MWCPSFNLYVNLLSWNLHIGRSIGLTRSRTYGRNAPPPPDGQRLGWKTVRRENANSSQQMGGIQQPFHLLFAYVFCCVSFRDHTRLAEDNRTGRECASSQHNARTRENERERRRGDLFMHLCMLMLLRCLPMAMANMPRIADGCLRWQAFARNRMGMHIAEVVELCLAIVRPVGDDTWNRCRMYVGRRIYRLAIYQTECFYWNEFSSGISVSIKISISRLFIDLYRIPHDSPMIAI